MKKRTARVSEDVLEILKAKGQKLTRPRQEILAVFVGESKPLNVESVYRKLKTKGIDRVTVYRTLNLFEKIGVVQRVNLRQDSTYFELVRNHHHHIVCTECGLIEDFDACTVDDMTKKVVAKSPYFSSVHNHSLELFSICKKCTNG